MKPVTNGMQATSIEARRVAQEPPQQPQRQLR